MLASKAAVLHHLDALQSQFFCIAVDLPGHGGQFSSAPLCFCAKAHSNARVAALSDRRFEPEAAAKLVTDLIKQEVPSGKAFIAGHSVGGLIALLIAHRFASCCLYLATDFAAQVSGSGPGSRADLLGRDAQATKLLQRVRACSAQLSFASCRSRNSVVQTAVAKTASRFLPLNFALRKFLPWRLRPNLNASYLEPLAKPVTYTTETLPDWVHAWRSYDW